MNKPEYVPENEANKIFWDFEILTDHPIQTRIPDFILIYKKKRNCHFADFAELLDNRVEAKEGKKLKFVRELKKL